MAWQVRKRTASPALYTNGSSAGQPRRHVGLRALISSAPGKRPVSGIQVFTRGLERVLSTGVSHLQRTLFSWRLLIAWHSKCRTPLWDELDVGVTEHRLTLQRGTKQRA